MNRGSDIMTQLASLIAVSPFKTTHAHSHFFYCFPWDSFRVSRFVGFNRVHVAIVKINLQLVKVVMADAWLGVMTEEGWVWDPTKKRACTFCWGDRAWNKCDTVTMAVVPWQFVMSDMTRAIQGVSISLCSNPLLITGKSE